MYAVTFVAAVLFFNFLRILGREQSLPPSPPGDPIIGHARRIPREYPWETFSEWKKTLGEPLRSTPACLCHSVANVRRGYYLHSHPRASYVHPEFNGMRAQSFRETKLELL